MPTIAISPGSTILVTGVNGLVGSHITDQLLKRGYNVRGVVRDVAKSHWLGEYFKAQDYPGKLELVEVGDMTVEGCYDGVAEGCEGIVQVASPLNGDDPNVAIPLAVKGAINALEAAQKTDSVKRVVYTSSSIAATFPKPDEVFEINDKSWNEDGVKLAWKNEDRPEKGLWLYAGLKTEAEKACWKWLESHKAQGEVGFVFNSVLPNANFGKVLVPEQQGAPSTIFWAKSAFTGEHFGRLSGVVQPQHFISTRDCALIHVSALIYEDVKDERLLAFAEPFSWTHILNIYKQLYPGREFPEPPKDEGVDKSIVKNERALEVLGWVKENKGWDGLEGALGEMSKLWV